MLELELPLLFLLANLDEFLFVHLNLLFEDIEFGLTVEVFLLEFPNLVGRGLSLSNCLGDSIVQFLESDQKSQIMAYVVHRVPLLRILNIQRRNR